MGLGRGVKPPFLKSIIEDSAERHLAPGSKRVYWNCVRSLLPNYTKGPWLMEQKALQ